MSLPIQASTDASIPANSHEWGAGQGSRRYLKLDTIVEYGRQLLALFFSHAWMRQLSYPSVMVVVLCPRRGFAASMCAEQRWHVF